MSILLKKHSVSFDPTNPVHRTDLWNFINSGSWKNAVNSYTIDGSEIDLVTHASRKMLRYYMNQEFGKTKA